MDLKVQKVITAPGSDLLEARPKAGAGKSARLPRITRRSRAKPRPPGKVQKIKAGKDWGKLPEFSVVGACGVLLVSLGDAAARTGSEWDSLLFWLGLILIIAPAAGRMLSPWTSERERLGLVVVTGFLLYLVKFMHSPVNFTFFDEFLHWRTLSDLIRSEHLFNVNPLLPSSAIFPGLEIITGALAKLSGLPFYPAGIVVVGAGRITFLLALYLIFKEISRSSRLAGIAALVYMTNPNFIFFDADFSYESLALPLSGLTIYTVIRRQKLVVYTAGTRGLTVVGLLTGAAVVVTHHITSYVLMGMLVGWTVLTRLTGTAKKGEVARPGPGGMALFIMVAAASWLLNIAGIIVNYLAPHLNAAANEMAGLLSSNQSSGRQLFENTTTGISSPLWERVITFGAVGLVLLGMPFGLWHVWKNYRANPLVLTLTGAALLYPVSLGFRLTRSGWEAANRSSEFLYLGVGLIVAFGILQVTTWRIPGWLRWFGPPLFSAVMAVMLIGGLIAGWNPNQRLPQPYRIEEGSRSIEPQGIEAAQWAFNYLGPNNFMGVYGTNMNLMGSFGDQNVSTTLSGGINVSWVLFAPRLEAEQIEQIQRGLLKYFVIDRRLTQAPYLSRSFYPESTMSEGLDKFNNIARVNRIFDSGDIIIYDIGAISGAG